MDFVAVNRNHENGCELNGDIESTTQTGSQSQHQSKLSNIINKKFHELIGRRVSHSPSDSGHVSLFAQFSGSPVSQSAAHASCNLDHIIADDAVSINSGSDNDGKDSIGRDGGNGNVDKILEMNLNDGINQSLSRLSSDTVVVQSKRTSVVSENAPTSEVNSDLP